MRDAAVDAVMVGGDQALRRHERRRATAEADDGAGRELGQLGQVGGVEFEAGGFQFLSHLWQLLRHPHAFVGMGGGAQDGERDQSLMHLYRFQSGDGDSAESIRSIAVYVNQILTM